MNERKQMSVAIPGCDLMIVNGYVLTMDERRTIYADGAVAIDGTRIVAVGPTRDVLARFRPRRTLDARGAAVHPGFIDAHYHATLHLTRGAITDNPHPHGNEGEGLGPNAYVAWLNGLEDEDEYASALMAGVEMARNGFTAFMDPGTIFEPDAVAAAAEAVGLRAVLADPFLWDRADAEGMSMQIGRAPADTKRALTLLGTQLARNRDPDALVRGHVAVYGIGSVSDELTKAAKACADAHGVVLAQHQNFTSEDVDFDTRRHGRHPLVHLGEIGVLGPNCTFTHMNVIRDDEVRPVVESGLSIVWHPGNYLFYGINRQAPSRMAALHHDGVNLAFGADVAKVWVFGELGWLAYLVARAGGDFLPSESILEMFTLGGAKALGLAHELGSLEAGKRADIVIRTDDLPDAQPNLDVVRQLVLVSRTKSIDTVIVNGRVIVRRSHHTLLDESSVYDVARRSAKRMAERTGLRPGSPWPTVA